MTGYGRATIHAEGATITAEIRSVNHRFLDISMNIPASFLFLEDKIKEVIKRNFSRGRIEVLVKIEGERFATKELNVDWDLMDQYVNVVKKAQQRYDLSHEISIVDLLIKSDLFEVIEKEGTSDELNKSILKCVTTAINHVDLIRKREGHYLFEEIKTIVEKSARITSLIKKHQITALIEYKTKIHDRIESHLKDTISIDETRLAPEIALLAEKGDLTEEITRLESHVNHMYNTLDKNEPVGRTIDFIAQEMQRETNTIGAKSLDGMISEYVVLLKGEIEKIREQAQNIE